MSVFDDILGNSEIPDDMEISVGDHGKMTMAELRAAQADRESLRRQSQEVAAERDRYRTEWENTNRAFTGVISQADKNLENEQKAPTQKELLREALSGLVEKDDPSDALFEDKLFGRALTKVEERAVERAMKENAALKQQFQELSQLVHQGFEGLTKAQVYEREQRWYDVNRSDIPKGQDGKKLSLGAIKQYAQERNMFVPQTNLLNLEAALESMTEPTRLEARMTEAERKGYEKGLAAARTERGKVLPMFGERSAGNSGMPAVETKGKSARQLVQEQLQRGLTDLSAENE